MAGRAPGIRWLLLARPQLPGAAAPAAPHRSCPGFADPSPPDSRDQLPSRDSPRRRPAPGAGGAAPARGKRCVRPPPLPGSHRPCSIARSRRSSAAATASAAPCPRSAAAPRRAAAAPQRPRSARRAPSSAPRRPAWRQYFRFRPSAAPLVETAELCPPAGGGSANERRIRRVGGSVPRARAVSRSRCGSAHGRVYFGPGRAPRLKSQIKRAGKGAVPGSPIVLAGRARNGPG